MGTLKRSGIRLSYAALVVCLGAAITLPASAQNVSPDRMVAEWMVRMGGSVMLEGQHRQISELADLPTTDFTIHTLNFTGITQWAFALEDELRRLPPLKHVKEVYINGRLWYDQPVSLVEATMGLFAGSPELEVLVVTRPVQTYIPFDDTVIKALLP
ncbi:MAG TPA: hypothetical protein VKR43_08115, partial [Bryobacteraceae bacterium]|nr:hypothetical protein [Bryobacteraceae bacterium]